MDSHFGMRLADWLIFRDAAKHFQKWILVRWTNPESLKYIGCRSTRYRYAPKPIDCKAKTAKTNAGAYRQAGLVVCPTTKGIGNLFVGESDRSAEAREKSMKAWNEFVDAHGGARDAEGFNRHQIRTAGTSIQRKLGAVALPAIGSSAEPPDVKLLTRLTAPASLSQRMGGARLYLVDRNLHSLHYGCLTLNGCYLHGDYDLKDVIDLQRPGRVVATAGTLHGHAHLCSADFAAVQKYVNDRIGIEMVQHDAEAYYAGHSEDTVEAFGPFGDAETLTGRAEIERWYNTVWHRSTIDLKEQQLSSVIDQPSSIRVPRTRSGILLGNDFDLP